MKNENQPEVNSSWVDTGTNILMNNPIGIGMIIVASAYVLLKFLPFAISQIGKALLAYRDVRTALLM